MYSLGCISPLGPSPKLEVDYAARSDKVKNMLHNDSLEVSRGRTLVHSVETVTDLHSLAVRRTQSKWYHYIAVKDIPYTAVAVEDTAGVFHR